MRSLAFNCTGYSFAHCFGSVSAPLRSTPSLIVSHHIPHSHSRTCHIQKKAKTSPNLQTKDLFLPLPESASLPPPCQDLITRDPAQDLSHKDHASLAQVQIPQSWLRLRKARIVSPQTTLLRKTSLTPGWSLLGELAIRTLADGLQSTEKRLTGYGNVS